MCYVKTIKRPDRILVYTCLSLQSSPNILMFGILCVCVCVFFSSLIHFIWWQNDDENVHIIYPCLIKKYSVWSCCVYWSQTIKRVCLNVHTTYQSSSFFCGRWTQITTARFRTTCCVCIAGEQQENRMEMVCWTAFWLAIILRNYHTFQYVLAIILRNYHTFQNVFAILLKELPYFSECIGHYSKVLPYFSVCIGHYSKELPYFSVCIGHYSKELPYFSECICHFTQGTTILFWMYWPLF